MEINGTKECFDEEIILVTYQAKAGQHVASEKGIIVALDLTITDELRDEGVARDIVRSIQDARRQIDCAITDTILIDIKGDVPSQWLDYICRETLSQMQELSEADMTFDLTYENGKSVRISVKK